MVAGTRGSGATTAVVSRLVCAGCGAVVPPDAPFTWACPAAAPGDDIDHVLRRVLDPSAMAMADEKQSPNPFVRYRRRFHAYHVARAAGWSDGRFVDLVCGLDEAIAEVDGHGFRATPIVRSSSLDEQLGFAPAGGVWVKDETGNVSGSHKARHLMGVMLGLRGGRRPWGWPIRMRRWRSPPAAMPPWLPRSSPAPRGDACWCSCHPPRRRRSSPACAP